MNQSRREKPTQQRKQRRKQDPHRAIPVRRPELPEIRRVGTLYIAAVPASQELAPASALFTDAQIRLHVEGGKSYVEMRLRSGLQSFRSNVAQNQRGLRRARQVAMSLGLELMIFEDAWKAMQAP